jgi:ElaB/YqjD/DUF883 family membrane-anchored ribosome-binding protein
MASKKPQQAESDKTSERPDETLCDDGEISDVEVAEEAVRRAKQQLKEARQAYWQLRRQAVEQLKQIREKSVGDLIDGTLKHVKRHPGPSVIVAVLAGFFLGRLFRR